MTRKRKIRYAELQGPASEPPNPEPGAPSAPDEPAAVVPDETNALVPRPSSLVPRLPASDRGEADARRRRRADRAGSPRDLATALNERLGHERGAPPPPVPAAGPAVPDSLATDASAPVQQEAGAMRRMTVEQVASDTMEFAVSTAVAAIPFRERARARSGSVELLLFHVGRELFAAPLASVEEAVELPVIRHLPEMADDMLGMFALRGRMMPIYSPSRPLGVSLGAAPTAALVVRAGTQRVALAVDDVDDVLTLDLGTLRDAPGVEDADGILLGVARRGHDLVAVLDGDALVAACLTDRPLETP